MEFIFFIGGIIFSLSELVINGKLSVEDEISEEAQFDDYQQLNAADHSAIFFC